MVSVLMIHPSLSRFTGERRLSAPGESVRDVLELLERQYPGFQERVRSSPGQFHSYLMVVGRYSGDADLSRITDPDDERRSLAELQFLPIPCGG